MAVVITNLGAVTAYADAVAGGYTGTKAEWQALMASYATVAEEAAQSATDAETAKDAAVTAKTDAETAKTDAIAAKTAAQTAKTAAETAQGKAEDAQGAAEDAAESVSASAAQIATNTSDISDLKEDLNHYKASTNTSNVLKNPLFLGGSDWVLASSAVIENTDTLANKVTITNSGTEQAILQKINLSDLSSGIYSVSYKKIGGITPRIRIYTERANGYYATYLANVISDNAEFTLDINAIQSADPLMVKLTVKFMLSNVGYSAISEPFLGIKSNYNGFWNENFYNHENRIKALEQHAPTLHGQKITFCGDSFTEGDFTGYVDSDGHSGTASDAYDSEAGMYKVFPYWIWKRTGCNKVMLAKSGYKLTNNATTSFTNSTSDIYYQNIPTDSDIIVIQFGLNDLSYSDGTWGSSDSTTWWGAFNEALDWITNNIPDARILVIASDGDMTYAKRNLLNKMAVAWGCAFLDLKSLDVPIMLGGKYAEDLEAKGSWGLKDSAKNRANAKYRVTETNTHPNVMAHLHRSYIIQNALEKL